MNKLNLLFATCLVMGLVSCSDDEVKTNTGDASYVGKAIGNFSEAEWYPGGRLGTTDNTSNTAYEDETTPVDEMGLVQSFQNGEQVFERNFGQQAPFNGAGPAWTRQACITCHPGYGHGKRMNRYNANDYGNGYLLVIYHTKTSPIMVDDPNNPGQKKPLYSENDYVTEVTGMPQTKASSPFLPPIDEDQIKIEWKSVQDEHGNKFPDGTPYNLEYPDVTIPESAFNTNPVPQDYAVRLESTIGIYGTGLIDAIPNDSLKAQYLKESAHATLNPAMWAGNDWASSAWYTLADGTKTIKRFTYALTRGSLQDGPGANAVWNITNVTRSDRGNLYTTNAWAKAMSENTDVINQIKSQKIAPYYDEDESKIPARVYDLLRPGTNQFENDWTGKTIKPEMSDKQFYDFMVWHRGLAVPRARNLNDADVQRGKQLFTEMGCVRCHRPSWTTGDDNYWAPKNVKAIGELPKYPKQTIWPYSDFVQHQLHMVNDIRTGWCRTTPLWGRGLSTLNTGAGYRLHDCRANSVEEAIMWHGYSNKSDAYGPAQKFYNLPTADRKAVVKFIESI